MQISEWGLSTCKVRRLPLDEAPGLPGSRGRVSLTFRLTNPKEV